MFQSVLIAALLFAPVHVEHPEGESTEEIISPLVVTEIQSFGELQLANGIGQLRAQPDRDDRRAAAHFRPLLRRRTAPHRCFDLANRNS